MKLTITTLLLFFALSVTGQVKSWSVETDMAGNLFPSYILATANNEPAKPERRTIDGTSYFLMYKDGPAQLSVDVETTDTARVKIEILPSKINEYSITTMRLLKTGTYIIYPKINYLYDVLRAQSQPTPLNITAVFSVNGQLIGQKTLTVLLRSVYDCPFYQQDGNINMQYMFAAYVNEDHPAVNQLLKEALQTGFVNSFTGYQKNNKQSVVSQLVAIWGAMAHRGIKYSNLTATSSNVDKNVLSQRIRTFQDVISGNQANCVDGSVFMASVCRAIGLKPFLVLVPGHCFLGVYLNQDKTEKIVIETTMIGSLHITELPMGSNQTMNLISNSFSQAESTAIGSFNGKISAFNSNDPRYQIIDIDYWRQTIRPIGL